MNKIPCIIKKILYDEGIAFVRLEFREHFLSAMLLEGNHQLKEGSRAQAIFKETEVMVCDKEYFKISARNRFVSKVLRIEMGQAIARIIFEFEGLEIASLISLEACKELGIEKNKVFQWFVKSSEVMLEYD
ncbi:TOBE domain-containing protein [Helicobacter sp. 11S03491-1]|uniref:TOBE domain-containing protein n=1 Tax=Helicobacter sp. 11S03491-1 TaxID=1476196 RepID=UPI000BA585AF|nr:TOBE domain-containing protein [Helicobacter sp. 11S03491-1]PAF41568.1 hypothetical protein BKH45_06615 [Helicobacter sp. 11S03491-1]